MGRKVEPERMELDDFIKFLKSKEGKRNENRPTSKPRNLEKLEALHQKVGRSLMSAVDSEYDSKPWRLAVPSIIDPLP